MRVTGPPGLVGGSLRLRRLALKYHCRWMIPESEVERIISGREGAKEVKAVIYARVSSSDQRSDLEEQIEYLTQYCSTKRYRVVDIISDIASWLKTNCRGLLKLFNYVVNKQVDVVVITY